MNIDDDYYELTELDDENKTDDIITKEEILFNLENQIENFNNHVEYLWNIIKDNLNCNRIDFYKYMLDNSPAIYEINNKLKKLK
jgi:hypothetical protein